MGNIGPNFRPPGQYAPTTKATSQAGEMPPANMGAPQASESFVENAVRTMSLSALFATGTQLNAEQTAAFLRNLLQLPKEMVELMAWLANVEGDSTQQLLKALLSEDVQIPLETLQQILQNQGGQAQEKLLKLLGTASNGYMQSAQQLGDLLQTLSHITTPAQDSAQQPAIPSLHATISLYLPFFPLHPPQQFTLRQETPEEKSGGEAQPEAILTILLTTLSLGRIKALIIQDGPKPDIFIEHGLPDAASIQALERAIQAGIQKECQREASLHLTGKTPVQIASSEKIRPKPARPTESGPGPKQEARLMPAQSISAMVALAAYALIRAVFELDNSLQSP